MSRLVPAFSYACTHNYMKHASEISPIRRGFFLIKENRQCKTIKGQSDHNQQSMTSFMDTESSVPTTSFTISDDSSDISIMDDNLVSPSPTAMFIIVYHLNITDSA